MKSKNKILILVLILLVSCKATQRAKEPQKPTTIVVRYEWFEKSENTEQLETTSAFTIEDLVESADKERAVKKKPSRVITKVETEVIKADTVKIAERSHPIMLRIVDNQGKVYYQERIK